jgi:hypothetical protein
MPSQPSLGPAKFLFDRFSFSTISAQLALRGNKCIVLNSPVSISVDNSKRFYAEEKLVEPKWQVQEALACLLKGIGTITIRDALGFEIAGDYDTAEVEVLNCCLRGNEYVLQLRNASSKGGNNCFVAVNRNYFESYISRFTQLHEIFGGGPEKFRDAELKKLYEDLLINPFDLRSLFNLHDYLSRNDQYAEYKKQLTSLDRTLLNKVVSAVDVYLYGSGYEKIFAERLLTSIGFFDGSLTRERLVICAGGEENLDEFFIRVAQKCCDVGRKITPEIMQSINKLLATVKASPTAGSRQLYYLTVLGFQLDQEKLRDKNRSTFLNILNKAFSRDVDDRLIVIATDRIKQLALDTFTANLRALDVVRLWRAVFVVAEKNSGVMQAYNIALKAVLAKAFDELRGECEGQEQSVYLLMVQKLQAGDRSLVGQLLRGDIPYNGLLNDRMRASLLLQVQIRLAAKWLEHVEAVKGDPISLCQCVRDVRLATGGDPSLLGDEQVGQIQGRALRFITEAAQVAVQDNATAYALFQKLQGADEELVLEGEIDFSKLNLSQYVIASWLTSGADFTAQLTEWFSREDREVSVYSVKYAVAADRGWQHKRLNLINQRTLCDAVLLYIADRDFDLDVANKLLSIPGFKRQLQEVSLSKRMTTANVRNESDLGKFIVGQKNLVLWQMQLLIEKHKAAPVDLVSCVELSELQREYREIYLPASPDRVEAMLAEAGLSCVLEFDFSEVEEESFDLTTFSKSVVACDSIIAFLQQLQSGAQVDSDIDEWPATLELTTKQAGRFNGAVEAVFKFVSVGSKMWEALQGLKLDVGVKRIEGVKARWEKIAAEYEHYAEKVRKADELIDNFIDQSSNYVRLLHSGSRTEKIAKVFGFPTINETFRFVQSHASIEAKQRLLDWAGGFKTAVAAGRDDELKKLTDDIVKLCDYRALKAEFADINYEETIEKLTITRSENVSQKVLKIQRLYLVAANDEQKTDLAFKLVDCVEDHPEVAIEVINKAFGSVEKICQFMLGQAEQCSDLAAGRLDLDYQDELLEAVHSLRANKLVVRFLAEMDRLLLARDGVAVITQKLEQALQVGTINKWIMVCSNCSDVAKDLLINKLKQLKNDKHILVAEELLDGLTLLKEEKEEFVFDEVLEAIREAVLVGRYDVAKDDFLFLQLQEIDPEQQIQLAGMLLDCYEGNAETVELLAQKFYGGVQALANFFWSSVLNPKRQLLAKTSAVANDTGAGYGEGAGAGAYVEADAEPEEKEEQLQAARDAEHLHATQAAADLFDAPRAIQRERTDSSISFDIPDMETPDTLEGLGAAEEEETEEVEEVGEIKEVVHAAKAEAQQLATAAKLILTVGTKPKDLTATFGIHAPGTETAQTEICSKRLANLRAQLGGFCDSYAKRSSNVYGQQLAKQAYCTCAKQLDLDVNIAGSNRPRAVR